MWRSAPAAAAGRAASRIWRLSFYLQEVTASVAQFRNPSGPSAGPCSCRANSRAWTIQGARASSATTRVVRHPDRASYYSACAGEHHAISLAAARPGARYAIARRRCAGGRAGTWRPRPADEVSRPSQGMHLASPSVLPDLGVASEVAQTGTGPELPSRGRCGVVPGSWDSVHSCTMAVADSGDRPETEGSAKALGSRSSGKGARVGRSAAEPAGSRGVPCGLAEVHLGAEVVQVVAVELKADRPAGVDGCHHVLPCLARGGRLLDQQLKLECSGQVPGEAARQRACSDSTSSKDHGQTGGSAAGTLDDLRIGCAGEPGERSPGSPTCADWPSCVLR